MLSQQVKNDLVKKFGIEGFYVPGILKEFLLYIIGSLCVLFFSEFTTQHQRLEESSFPYLYIKELNMWDTSPQIRPFLWVYKHRMFHIPHQEIKILDMFTFNKGNESYYE